MCQSWYHSVYIPRAVAGLFYDFIHEVLYTNPFSRGEKLHIFCFYLFCFSLFSSVVWNPTINNEIEFHRGFFTVFTMHRGIRNSFEKKNIHIFFGCCKRWNSKQLYCVLRGMMLARSGLAVDCSV